MAIEHYGNDFSVIKALQIDNLRYQLAKKLFKNNNNTQLKVILK